MLNEKKSPTLASSLIETPLGPMMAIADDNKLYFLDFIDQKKYDWKIAQLESKTKAPIIPATNTIIALITQELAAYFAGTLQQFTTPIAPLGSVFQDNVWKTLITIPYGTTITYAQEARMIGNKNAFRAVANANSRNTLAIIIPCHRIISSNGTLCGYAGGIHRKKWLIEHEQKEFVSFDKLRTNGTNQKKLKEFKINRIIRFN